MYKTKKKHRPSYFNKKTSNMKCNAGESRNVNLGLFTINYTFFFTSKTVYYCKITSLAYSLHCIVELTVNHLTGFYCFTVKFIVIFYSVPFKMFGMVRFFSTFLKESMLLCLTRLHLFDQKFSKTVIF